MVDDWLMTPIFNDVGTCGDIMVVYNNYYSLHYNVQITIIKQLVVYQEVN